MLQQEAALDELFDDIMLVGPMDRARLGEVIQGPAKKAGIEFEPGLVERMVEDTSSGDALPFLAYTLQQLYVGRDDHAAIIRRTDYAEVGGVLGALKARANTVAASLTRAGHGAAILPTLLKLTTIGAEGAPVRRLVTQSDLGPEERRVVQAFVEARLLTTDGPAVQVAHEALLRAWPPLSDAIRASRGRLRAQADIARLASDWQESGRLDGYLLQGERLQATRGALGGEPASGDRLDGLGTTERTYYKKSVALDERRRAARRRRLQLSFIGAGIVIAILVVAFGVSVWQYGVARDQRDIAQAERLSTEALGLLSADPEQALVLSRRAYDKRHTSLSEGVLRAAAAHDLSQGRAGQRRAGRDAARVGLA